MLAFLPLLLAFSSLATSAAIPSSLIPGVRDTSAPQSAWESTDSSRVSGQSANQDAEAHNFPQRTPYYFPETMPDNDEITERFTALREAGFASVALSEKESETPVHRNQPQQSIGTPDVTTIDPPRARMLILPDRESSAELAQSLESSYSPRTGHEIQNDLVVGQALRIDWVISEAPILIATPPIIPSIMFLFFIAAILCIATVVRGVRHRR